MPIVVNLDVMLARRKMKSKDLADAYVAWFQIRAQWAQAVFQWNVAVVRLDRAAGEFHAGGRRP